MGRQELAKDTLVHQTAFTLLKLGIFFLLYIFVR